MSRDSRGYGEVAQATEPLREESPFAPLEIRVEEREERRRRVGSTNRTRTRSRFVVVRHSDETVLMEGRWSTGDRHNPIEAARARAFGFVAGYAERDPNLSFGPQE